MKVKKWTEYYGVIRLVTLDQNDAGEFTGGFVCESIGAGVSSDNPSVPTEEPDPYFFYDTYQHAQEGFVLKYEGRIAELEVYIRHMEKTIEGSKENIANLQRRIEEIKKQEHFR